MSEVTFEVAPADAGSRLDAVAAGRAGLSRAAVARLIEDGAVTVDGVVRKAAFKLGAGQLVRVAVPDVEGGALAPSSPEPQAFDVPIRFEDEWLLVVAKPAGLVVHPAPGHSDRTLVNALLARAGKPVGGSDVERPGIVHRLDAGTSGLMIVAKDEGAHERLIAMMAARQVSRTYLALVEGVPSTESGTIDAPIGRSARNRKKMGVVAGGRDSVSDFRVLERFADEASLLEVRPRTGRTHQIRVHLGAIGHAVVGDAVYGKNRKLARSLGLERPFLHAAALRFTHPVTGAELSIDEPLPDDLREALDALRARSAGGIS